jgi:hypothetical protein
MTERYERCISLRPELFKLASVNVDEKNDAVGDILHASDELTRVIDSYKENVILKSGGGFSTSSSSHSSASAAQDTDASNSLCLLDLSLDSPSTPSTTAEVNGATASSSSSLLDDQFKLLGLDTPPPVNPSASNGLPAVLGGTAGMGGGTNGFLMSAQPSQLGNITTAITNNNFPPQLVHLQNLNAPSAVTLTGAPSNSSSATVNYTQTPPKKDLLDFDIFESDFLKGSKPTLAAAPTTTVIKNTNSLENSTTNSLIDVGMTPNMSSTPAEINTPSTTTPLLINTQTFPPTASETPPQTNQTPLVQVPVNTLF